MERLFLLSHHYERVKLPAASANKWILGNMRFPEDFLLLKHKKSGMVVAGEGPTGEFSPNSNVFFFH
jgi:hypothetical protein